MISVYNFIGSWQLFPEKGIYEYSDRPKSGICVISSVSDSNKIGINTSWVTLENQAFASSFEVVADGEMNPFSDRSIAEKVKTDIISSIHFEIFFYLNDTVCLHVIHELMPNGYLKITRKGFTDNQLPYTITEVYHRQMNVMPFATAASGAIIKPNEEGIIKHKALSAMEEQTHMQLNQIRRQIELLALQAQEIQKRKELSMIIYDAKISFNPVIGSAYFLYQQKDDSHILSMIGPNQWGKGGPYKEFIAEVKLLADHTWVEV